MSKLWMLALAGLLIAASLGGCKKPDDTGPDCEAIEDPCPRLDQRRCNGDHDGTEICAQDEEGCLYWAADEGCGENQDCVLDDGEPTCECDNDCDSEGDTVCAGSEIRECFEDEDGCFYEEAITDCRETDQICSDEGGTPECIGCTEDRCDTNGEMRCNDDNAIEECTRQDDGCLDWEEVETCGEAAECIEDDGDADCVALCEDLCDEEDATQCNGDEALETCLEQDDGCLDWEVTDACDDDGDYCDATGDVALCAACENECDTVGATQCNTTMIETCTADENGCLAWADPSDCAALDPVQACRMVEDVATCMVVVPGDTCAEAIVVGALPYMLSGDDFTADFSDSFEMTDESCVGRSGSPEAIFLVSLTAGQTLVVRELGGLDVVLSLQAAGCGGGGVCAFSLDSDSGEVVGQRYTAEADIDVFVIVETYSSDPSTTDYEIHLDLSADEVCDDELDNDFDGDADCDDEDCFGTDSCDTETNCSDDADNDLDELVDCDDDDCVDAIECTPYMGIYELFDGDGDDVDLEGMILIFTPNDEADEGYDWDTELNIFGGFVVEPGTGDTTATLVLADDGSAEHTFATIAGVEFYGETYDSIFVSSNGYVTFGEGSTSFSREPGNFFLLPGIMGLRRDLDPSSGGTITVDEFTGDDGSGVAVTFDGVPRWGNPDGNSFQMLIGVDGEIVFIYEEVAETMAAVGIVDGNPDGVLIPEETNYIDAYRGIYEEFEGEGDRVDLVGNSITFTPDDSYVGYEYDVMDGVDAFAVVPGTGTTTAELDLDDDDSEEYTFVNLPAFTFFGVEYTSIFVSSNGFITFDDAPSGLGIYDTVEELFSQPVVAGLSRDLDPASDDEGLTPIVTVDDSAEQLVVTFEDVPRLLGSEPNDFQMILNADGSIELVYLTINETDAVVGISSGEADGFYPDEMDFVVPPDEVCDDDEDNDFDGDTDCDDEDCTLDPACVVPLINEVVYEDLSSDNQEFLEIFTDIGDFDLTGYTLVHHNGSHSSGGSPIWEIDLTGYSTDEDGYFVIGSTLVPEADAIWADFGVSNTSSIQNGPDSLVLYEEWDSEEEEGIAVDALAWEEFDDDEFPFGEGDTADGIRFDNWNNSIGRVPGAEDTDDNFTDFVGTWWPTPGAANTIAQPDPDDFTRLAGSALMEEDSLPADIPDDDADGVELVITTPGWLGGIVADVHVGVRIDHPWRGDLIATLTSPSGTTVTLHNLGGGEGSLMTVYDLVTDPAEDSMDDFTGDTAGGDWTLHVSDHVGDDVGQVIEWVLWIDAIEIAE